MGFWCPCFGPGALTGSTYNGQPDGERPESTKGNDMTEESLRRAAALFGLSAAVLLMIEIPLYFMYDGAPPDWNILSRVLIGTCSVILLMVFFVALGQLIRRVHPGLDWVGTTVQTAGAVWVGIELVAMSMEAGTAIASAAPIDPTIDGPLAPGTFLLHSSMSRLLAAVLLIGIGYAIRRTGLAPAWMGKLSYLLAVFHLALVPGMFFGSEPARFYSAEGWGTTAFAGGVTSIWVIVISVGLLRAGRIPAAAAATTRELART